MDVSAWSLLLLSIENFVLINVALSIAMFGLAAIARAWCRTWHPLLLSRLYAAALIIPPLLSAWLVTASLLPAIWLGASRWIQEHQALHTTHLLNRLTAPIDPLVGYAALAFVLLAALATLYAVASGYFRIGRVVRWLELDAEPASPERVKQVENSCRRYGIDIGLVVSRFPSSFVRGCLRSKLVISTGLLNALSSEELSALLEHEAAHHARRDNLSKWVLTICRYMSPAFPLTRLLYRWWSEQVEIVCDEIAVRRTSAPAEVAGALVRLKRLTLTGLPLSPQTTESGFTGGSYENFERRVIRVLSLGDRPPIGEKIGLLRSWGRTSTIVGGAFALTLLTLFIISPLAVHRVIELLLHAL
ncbi:MAG: M56 family metallopeptidase [Blastocatellia bacterium]|nr:M56 family metallopeptidase [Blastocatellia bacterium]